MALVAFSSARISVNVGPAVAATLVADLPELGTLDGKAVASLAGLAPHVRKSGAGPATAYIAGGRSCVRTALYMAALASVRSKTGFGPDYRAMRKAGKPPKVALIAIARKIAGAAKAMVQAARTWNQKTAWPKIQSTVDRVPTRPQKTGALGDAHLSSDAAGARPSTVGR